MSNAHVAPATHLSKAELIQLNAVHMTASFLTHEGFAAAAGEEHYCVRKHLVSLNIKIWTSESPDAPVLAYLNTFPPSFLYFRDIQE